MNQPLFVKLEELGRLGEMPATEAFHEMWDTGNVGEFQPLDNRPNRLIAAPSQSCEQTLPRMAEQMEEESIAVECREGVVQDAEVTKLEDKIQVLQAELSEKNALIETVAQFQKTHSYESINDRVILAIHDQITAKIEPILSSFIQSTLVERAISELKSWTNDVISNGNSIHITVTGPIKYVELFQSLNFADKFDLECLCTDATELSIDINGRLASTNLSLWENLLSGAPKG